MADYSQLAEQVSEQQSTQAAAQELFEVEMLIDMPDGGDVDLKNGDRVIDANAHVFLANGLAIPVNAAAIAYCEQYGLTPEVLLKRNKAYMLKRQGTIHTP